VKVSVVIPTYNQVQYIGETVQSVLNQTHENLEIIIADDCSTDGTIEKIKKFAAQDNRIKLLLSERNKGIPSNFNRAFNACTGEYVAFLGGDDLMFPDKIEKQVLFLEENKDYVLVQSDMELFDSQSGKTVKRLSDNGIIPTNPLDWALKVDWNFENKYSGVLPSSCLARADYYLSARYTNELYLKHELLFTIECYCHNPKGKWGVIPQILGRYRLHESNFSQSKTARNSIVLENFKLAELARVKCKLIRKSVDEFEFFTAYKVLLSKSYSSMKELNMSKQLFNKHASKLQKFTLPIGVFLCEINLLGLYKRLNIFFGIFK
jgi:glycosyltransferase involved in cell wall biosynthesis